MATNNNNNNIKYRAAGPLHFSIKCNLFWLFHMDLFLNSLYWFHCMLLVWFMGSSYFSFFLQMWRRLFYSEFFCTHFFFFFALVVLMVHPQGHFLLEMSSFLKNNRSSTHRHSGIPVSVCVCRVWLISTSTRSSTETSRDRTCCWRRTLRSN